MGTASCSDSSQGYKRLKAGATGTAQDDYEYATEAEYTAASQLLGSEVGSLHMSLPGATHTARQFKLQLQMLEAQAELASSPQHSAPLKQAPAPRLLLADRRNSEPLRNWLQKQPSEQNLITLTTTPPPQPVPTGKLITKLHTVPLTQVRMLQQMLLDPGHLTVTLV